MGVMALLILSVLVGWLATLILYSDIGRVSLQDFVTGVIGAGIAGGLVAPVFGIPMIGEYCFRLLGAFASLVGTIGLLTVAYLKGSVHFLCCPLYSREFSVL